MGGTRLEAAVLGVVLSVFAFLLIAGHNRWSGDEILHVTQRHGLNGGDSLVLGLWLVGMATIWRIGLSDEDQRAIVSFVTRTVNDVVAEVRHRRSQALAWMGREVSYWRATARRAYQRHRRRMISFLETEGPRTVVVRQTNDDAGRARRDPRDL